MARWGSSSPAVEGRRLPAGKPHARARVLAVRRRLPGQLPQVHQADQRLRHVVSHLQCMRFTINIADPNGPVLSSKQQAP